MTWQNMLDRVDHGETDMILCASGDMLTNSGNHEAARRIFEARSKAGNTGTMTWTSCLKNNELWGDCNPDFSAEWDRRAAELGDPIGQFYHGVNLLRGHGNARDEAEGRRMIGLAADAGVAVAKRLIAAGYDLDEVTPDADNWRYAPAF